MAEPPPDRAVSLSRRPAPLPRTGNAHIYMYELQLLLFPLVDLLTRLLRGIPVSGRRGRSEIRVCVCVYLFLASPVLTG